MIDLIRIEAMVVTKVKGKVSELLKIETTIKVKIIRVLEGKRVRLIGVIRIGFRFLHVRSVETIIRGSRVIGRRGHVSVVASKDISRGIFLSQGIEGTNHARQMAGCLT